RPVPGDGPGDGACPGGRVQETGEHLEGRGPSGPVRSQEADDLTGLDAEGDSRDGVHVTEAPPEDAADRRAEARLTLMHLERLAEIANVDAGLGHRGMMPASKPVSECIILRTQPE